MPHQPDIVGTVFSAACTAIMLCLTIWPRLWIVLAINRRWAAEEYRRKRQVLPIVSGIGVLLGIWTTLTCYFWS